MHLFSMLGIPVSTSSAIVGAVVGVGLVKGARSISKKTIVTILVGWVLTPRLAGFLRPICFDKYDLGLVDTFACFFLWANIKDCAN